MRKNQSAAQPEYISAKSSAKRGRLVPETSVQGMYIDAGAMTEPGERASSLGVFLFGGLVFTVVLGACAGIMFAARGVFDLLTALISFLVAVLVTMSVHIAQQWERVVVLRLGKANRVAGPGIFFTIPFIEANTIRVDVRTRSTTFGAEETLSADLVPLTVNAVLLWMVYDAKAACTEVADFSRTVQLVAQAALRDAIGRLSAAEVAIRREQLDEDLKETLEEEAAQWGISILQVKVRDILVPTDLQNVMSLEAQAEQRRKARIALAETEQDIAAMIEEVAGVYGGPESALKLRQMLLLSETVQETGSAVVVPSSFSEGFGDVLGQEGRSALQR